MRNILRKPLYIFGSATLLLVAVLGTFMVRTVQAASQDAPKSGERLLVVHDGSTKRGFLTKSTTVGDALKEAGISFNDNDLVEPALSEELVASNYDINIYRARPVTVIDGAVRKKIMSAYRTAPQIVKHADIEIRDEDITEMSLPVGVSAGGVELTITRATELNLVLYGEKLTIYTQEKTVADLMKEKEIALGQDDTLSVKESDPIVEGMTIEIWREGKQTVTVEEDVEFGVEQIQDVDRPVGYREIKTPGVSGKRSVTYEIEMKNGKEVGRKEIQSIVLVQPKKQVEVVGAKNNYSNTLNEWLHALRTCETNGNYRAATGNGYFGAYQFLPSTWNSIAQRTGRTDLVGVLPSQAAPADQDAMVIANANATAGLSTQHPGCYHKLGLSNKPPAQ